MVVNDIELASFDEEFYKRLAIANKIIEERNDPVFTHWANILLSDTLVISYGMVSKILRASESTLRFNAAHLLPYDSWRTTIPLSIIPDIAKRIDYSRHLFWYSDKDGVGEYRLPNSELPQYL